MNRRQNSNKILFHFDSLVDFHLAVVYSLQKDYPSGGSNPSIDYYFLHQTRQELTQFRVFGIGKNIVQECFNPPVKNSYDAIYQSYISDRFDTTIQKAPITNILRMMATIGKVGKGAYVKSYLYCENDVQARIARSIIKSIPVEVLVDDPKNIDLNEYARFIIGDIRDMDAFNPPQCLHIAVLNYGSNLQIVGKEPVLVPEYVIKYGDVNIFQVIDAYNNVMVPENLKKET